MKRLLFFAIPLLFAIVVFSLITFFLSSNAGKGALQVTANPKSNVLLNGKSIGQTPLCKCDAVDMLTIGDYTIRIEPFEVGFSPFEEKIKITKSVLTVVDRTFGRGATSEGSIITLTSLHDKKAVELLTISFPDNASIFVDNNVSGNTPILLKDLTVSDHEVKLVRDGYKEKTVRIRTVPGYKLGVTAFLGIDQKQQAQKTPPATPSAAATPTPVAAKVVILQTPTGFLRVRANNSLRAAEIVRVSPGESFELIDEATGWFQIKLSDGRVGWISAQYAKKQ